MNAGEGAMWPSSVHMTAAKPSSPKLPIAAPKASRAAACRPRRVPGKPAFCLRSRSCAMRFNVGEVWKSVEAGGVSHRAAVASIEDDGRRGTLLFDNGDEQSFLWADLTQFGRWQIDPSPKPTRSGDELRELILRQIQRHPICPELMGVAIRHTTGEDWAALPAPPPGHTTHPECAAYITTVARALRSLYGVRFTELEATTSLNINAASVAAAASATDNQGRRSAAAFQSGATGAGALGAVGTLATFSSAPIPDPSVEVAIAGTSAVNVAAAVESRLSVQPAEISEAARELSKAIADQIAELTASKPNDPDRFAQQNDFVAFLQSIAGGLDSLAQAIDGAIAAGSADKPEPVLLQKAGEIAHKTTAAIVEGLERNKSYIVDCTIKFSVFAAGLAFLHVVGADLLTTAVVAAIMNLKLRLPKMDGAKK
jgi:hypothetical protein